MDTRQATECAPEKDPVAEGWGSNLFGASQRAGPLRPFADQLGADTPVLDWRERLFCSRCNGLDVDFVVSWTKQG